MGIPFNFWNAILDKNKGKNMKNYLSIILFICLSISLLTAEVRIGYIDSNEIMNNNEDVKQVQISLEKEQRRLQSEMEGLIRQIDSLKQDYEVSCKEIDFLIDISMEFPHWYGGRIMGGGFGGCTINLINNLIV